MDVGKNLSKTFSILFRNWKLILVISILTIGTITILGLLIESTVTSSLRSEFLQLRGQVESLRIEDLSTILYKIMGLTMLFSLLILPISTFLISILLLTLLTFSEEKKFKFSKILNLCKEVFLNFLILSFLWTIIYFLLFLLCLHFLLSGWILFFLLLILIEGVVIFFILYPLQLFSTLEVVCKKERAAEAIGMAWDLMKKDYLMILLIIIVGPIIFIAPITFIAVLLSIAFQNPLATLIFSFLAQIFATPAFSLFMILCWKELRG